MIKTILQFKSINRMMTSVSDLESPISDQFINNDNDSDFCLYESDIRLLRRLLVSILWSGFTILYQNNILSLVNVSPIYVHNICSGSHMWEYIMANTIYLGIFALYLVLNYDDYQHIKKCTDKTFAGIMICVSLSFWGALETSVSCANELSHTLLYTMLLTNVLMVAAIWGLLMLIFTCWIFKETVCTFLKIFSKH